MYSVSNVEELRRQVKAWKKEGLTVGLCPTMGYLHEGHASLIDRSVASCDRTVVSIFVNPIQFGPTEDLESYPRDLEKDSAFIEAHGADLIFHPQPSDMYYEDFGTYVEVPQLSSTLCGVSRPVHFRGVCTVIAKLLNTVCPDKIFFGQKDAQQLAIIRRMVRDLNFDVEIVACPIVREADGLAKSSRNTYLSPEERKAAVVLSRSIRTGQQLCAAGERSAFAVLSAMRKTLAEEKLANVEYVEAVDGKSMQPVSELKDGDLVAMAVRFGTTRLIDNFTVGDPMI